MSILHICEYFAASVISRLNHRNCDHNIGLLSTYIYLTLHISIYNFTLFIYVSTYILFPSPSSFYHTHTHTQHTHTHISVRSDFHIYSGQQLHSSRSGDKKDDIIIIYMNKNIHICLYVSIKENGGALFESILSGRGRSISFGDGRISDEWRLGSLAVGFVDRYYFFFSRCAASL